MRPHELLDSAIEARRLQRGTTWSELASQVGVSESALRNIRRGRNLPSPLTKHRLEEALWWEAGSIDAILDGREPTPRDRVELQERYPNLYSQGYQLGQTLDPATLASVLRTIDSQLLIAELARRLAALEHERNRNET